MSGQKHVPPFEVLEQLRLLSKIRNSDMVVLRTSFAIFKSIVYASLMHGPREGHVFQGAAQC